MIRSRLSAGQMVLRDCALTAAALLIVLSFRSILHVNQTTVALTFLVLIQLTAFYWDLASSIYLSLVCTLLYNYFFLPPIGTFRIADAQNWVALAAFLGSAIFISKLSESERREAEISKTRRMEMERLYNFSQQILMEERPNDLARHAPRMVAETFDLPSVALYLTENDSVYFSDAERNFVSQEELRTAAQSSDAPRRSLQGTRILPLMLGIRANGSVAMIEREYSDELYDAIGGLLAIALARATALERFSRVEAAREGERLRVALLDSVTHELRTPLTAIRAAATCLLSQPALGEAQQREMFSIVDEESARLDQLIGRAVEMAQLDTEGIQLRLHPQQLPELIDMALEDSRALLRGRPVSLDLPQDTTAISMDRELIRRVFRHLLENAARYSPEGSPLRISASRSPERLLVSVSDEGQGIEKAEQPFIFDKFYRGSRHIRRVHGTGMGLAIAKAILHAHHGGIDVLSHPGQGATFTFWIPVKTAEPGASSP